MSFVKACFDTMYFLNEDKREEQLKEMLKGKGVKLRKPDKKPKKQFKNDNPFRYSFKEKQKFDNPFLEAKYIKINQSIQSS